MKQLLKALCADGFRQFSLLAETNPNRRAKLARGLDPGGLIIDSI
jgi:hypothetical protein